MKELADKTNIVDVVIGQLDGLPIQELMYRVYNLEANPQRLVAFSEEIAQRALALKGASRWFTQLPKSNCLDCH